MQPYHIITVFLTFFTMTNALVFDWASAITGATGAGHGCPPTAAAAIMEEDGSNLQHCTEETLRSFYRQNSCCASYLASCNLIEREWWQKTDIWHFKPICKFYEKLVYLERQRLKKNFLRRIREKPLFRIFGKPELHDDAFFSAEKL